MAMGASRTTKLLGMDLDPRLTANVATSKHCAATSQRISQLRRIAHKEAGPSPHDPRTFVIGYGASKLRYGSELIWELTKNSAKNEMQKTYAGLARIVREVASKVQREPALLEANIPAAPCCPPACGSPCLITHALVGRTGSGNQRLSLRLAQVSASRHYLGTSYMPL
ncbi:putative Reverse transcriptase (RNA-dependent DNA polymerase)/RNase H [Trypanosoma cruzi]|nr:putative Reverse transcriptase (RNA-dependent DNA polymerase)/RNase H [Trypanosoma cruzi]